MIHRPIPRALLPHSALLHTESTDAWQRPVRTDTAALKHIRVEAESSRSINEKDTVHRLKWLLYYDCRNSLPRGMTFSPGQVVEWREHRLMVMQVRPVWEEQQLHHYELDLEGV